MVVWGLLPALTVLSPLVVWSLVTVLNHTTHGHGVLTATGSLALTAWARSMIISYAPSTQAKNDALYQSRWIIPLISFILSRQICVKLLEPVFEKIGMTELLRFTPWVPYMIALRLAGSMALLGLAVIMRFIGPCSIVRCSSFPLVSHPVSSQVRAFLAKCTSFVAFLELIAAPSDTPGILLRSPFSTPGMQEGRRYQTPSIKKCLALVMASTLIGLVLSYVIHPALSNEMDIVLIFVACSTSILADLFRCLDGRYHEIDPTRYQNMDTQTILSFYRMFPQKASILMSVLLVPVGSMLLNAHISRSLIGSCILVVACSSSFLIAVDLFTRVCLCLPTLQVSRLVEEISGDFTPESTLDVILCSILQGNSELIDSIWAPTRKPGTLMIEEEEIERNDKSMEMMSKLILQEEPVHFVAQLEQDILRISILESFGGGTNIDCERQHTMIKNLVHPKDAPLSITISGRGEPLAVPFVRALCAYAGGLGLALSNISISSKYSGNFVTWDLPPGAVACAQWAVVASSRFLVESISRSGKMIENWRSSHLSMLVPVVFHAAFTLRKGILNFIDSRPNGSRDGSTPVLTVLLDACDKAAISILEQVRDLTRNFDVQVRSECRLWLEPLITRCSTSSTLVPVLAHEGEHIKVPLRFFAYP